jgi:2,3-bisphosphoglycerate-dependent phosphoglycerate mutase
LTRWILIRHGESSANADGVLSGWLDVPLTDKGREQAINVGEQLFGYDIDRVWSSDLQRAQETAQLAMKRYTEKTGIQPQLNSTSAFRERCFGKLQGRLKKELREEGTFDLLNEWSPDIYNLEGFCDLARRVLPKMDECQKPGTNVLFAHGGVIRLLYGLLVNLPREKITGYHIENAVPIVVESPQNGWIFLQNNIG